MALALATRGYIKGKIGTTLDKGPKVTDVKTLKPVIRSAGVQSGS